MSNVPSFVVPSFVAHVTLLGYDDDDLSVTSRRDTSATTTVSCCVPSGLCFPYLQSLPSGFVSSSCPKVFVSKAVAVMVSAALSVGSEREAKHSECNNSANDLPATCAVVEASNFSTTSDVEAAVQPSVTAMRNKAKKALKKAAKEARTK